MPSLLLLAAAAAGLTVAFVTNPVLTARADNPDGAPLLHTPHTFPHGYMEYDAAAGQTITDTLTLQNTGSSPATFVVFAADGLTSQATGVVYGDEAHPFPDGPSGNGEYGAGRWISLSQSSASLAPGESTTINVTIAVPPAATPGDWVGAVSAENPVPTRAGGQFGLSVTTRTTIAAVLHVAGPAKIEGVNVGSPFVTVENKTRQILNIPLQYFGDVLVKPYVNIRLDDARGRTLLQINRQLDTFVPHTTLIFPVPLDSLLLDPGNYHVPIDFGPQGHEQHFDRSFSVTGPQAQLPRRAHTGGLGQLLWLVGLVPLLLGLLAVLFVLRRRRTCAHCGRPYAGKRMSVAAVPEVRSCARCQTALARRGTRVRLCADCVAGHRGWRRQAAPMVVPEVAKR
jgi:hypothetical protein